MVVGGPQWALHNLLDILSPCQTTLALPTLCLVTMLLPKLQPDEGSFPPMCNTTPKHDRVATTLEGGLYVDRQKLLTRFPRHKHPPWPLSKLQSDLIRPQNQPPICLSILPSPCQPFPDCHLWKEWLAACNLAAVASSPGNRSHLSPCDIAYSISNLLIWGCAVLLDLAEDWTLFSLGESWWSSRTRERMTRVMFLVTLDRVVCSANGNMGLLCNSTVRKACREKCTGSTTMWREKFVDSSRRHDVTGETRHDVLFTFGAPWSCERSNTSCYSKYSFITVCQLDQGPIWWLWYFLKIILQPCTPILVC